jgi:hypothetical protein
MRQKLKLPHILFSLLLMGFVVATVTLAQGESAGSGGAAGASDGSAGGATMTEDGTPITKIPGGEEAVAPEKKKEKSGNTLIRIRKKSRPDEAEQKVKDKKKKAEQKRKADAAKKKPRKRSRLYQKLQAGKIISVDTPIGDSRIKGTKAVAVINSHPAIVWEIIIDYQAFEHYWPDIITSMLIDSMALEETKKKSLNSIDDIENYFDIFVTSPLLDWDNISGMYSSYLYLSIEVPTLPLKWVMVKIDHNEKLFEKGIFSVRWKMIRGDMATYEGYIKLEPFGDKVMKTKLTMSRFVDPGVNNLPASLVYYYPEVNIPMLINRIRDLAKNNEAEYLKNIEEKGRINYVDLGTVPADSEEESKQE